MNKAVEEWVQSKRPRLMASELQHAFGPTPAELHKNRVPLGPLGRKLLLNWAWGATIPPPPITP